MKSNIKSILFLLLIIKNFNSYAFDKDTLFICKNDGIIYTNNTTAGTPISWQWTFQMGDVAGSTLQNPPPVYYNTAGVFLTTVKTTFDNGKDTTDKVIIVVKDWPMPRFNFPNDTGYCQGNSFPLVLNTINYPFAEYEWSTGAKSPSITINTAGTYWVKVLLRAGRTCDSIYRQVNVTEYPNPSVYLGQDKFMCQNQSFTLDAGAGTGYRYSWLPNNQTTRTITVNIPDIYSVTITNANGCTATDVIELKDSCPHYAFVPNAFSPNEDRLNDVFHKVFNFTPKDYIFRIYNRWGELLFETTDLAIGWNGKYNNELVQQDIYMYQIQYLDTDKKVYNLRGTFYVVR